jgi:hypothetical protein
MKCTGPQIVSELRGKLQFDVGRHLYVALGAYRQLERFVSTDLAQGSDRSGQPFPPPTNLNRSLLQSLTDEDLRQLVRDEARQPEAIQRRLNQSLQDLLQRLFAEQQFLILDHLELLFAYSLDLSVFRTIAANNHHLLLLLPGQRHGDHVTLFHEADARFHRPLSEHLVAENHVWELIDD